MLIRILNVLLKASSQLLSLLAICVEGGAFLRDLGADNDQIVVEPVVYI
jgi:hypothetical protein